MTVVTSQGIFMSTRSRSSATNTNIIQPSTVLTDRWVRSAFAFSLCKFGPVSTLVVLTNVKGKASAEIEVL
jgi:hypothetical protein